jgi:hypothetical protein
MCVRESVCERERGRESLLVEGWVLRWVWAWVNWMEGVMWGRRAEEK